MSDYFSAAADFKRARDKATFERLMARITGRSTELLSYEDVRQKVRASGIVSHSLVEVPLDAIIGSVNRYNDFSRSFLPRQDSDKERWTKIYKATSDLSGLPPVDLYRIGDAYFVQDGHHRVSVARQMGSDSIQAYVTEIQSKVPIDPLIQPDQLILKAEYVDFLRQTNLGTLVPDSDFTVTRTGQYQKLLEHIALHQYFMGLEYDREIAFEEAVTSWNESVYCPVVYLIRDLGILRDFPGRTETDLYLWISKHRTEKEEELGWEIPNEIAAVDLVDTFGEKSSTVFSRVGRQLLEVVLPEENESPNLQSQIRKSRSKSGKSLPLFADILVPLSGGEPGWLALEQALEVAKKDDSRLKGLTVVSDKDAIDYSETTAIRDRFLWRCGESGTEANFAIETGEVAKAICSRARWTDLVVIGLANPPQDKAKSRLTSGIRKIIQSCNRPVLFIPGNSTPITKVVLPYNGSPKSREALFIAAYIAGYWQLPLLVVHVNDLDEDQEAILDEAREYLKDYEINSEFHSSAGPVDQVIVETALQHSCDLIIIGGYSARPLVEVIRGSVVDSILRQSKIPTLICS